MKRISLMLVAALVMLTSGLLTSCSSCTSANDAKKLLETVPSSSPGAIVFNVANSINKTGFNLEDNPAFQNMDRKDAKKMKKLFDSKSNGVSMTVGVLYLVGDQPVITFGLTDADKFKDFCSDMAEEEIHWSKDGKITYSPDLGIIIKGNQAWICNRRSALIEDVDKVANVKPEKSFAAKHSNYDKMMDFDAACSMLVTIEDLNKWCSMTGDSEIEQYGSVLSMGAGLIGEDVKYFAVNSTSDKNSVTIEAQFFNSKGEDVKSNVHMNEIDTEALTKNLSNADLVAAVGVDSKFVNKILNMLGAFVNSSDVDEAKAFLGNINGTSAMSMNFNPQYMEPESADVLIGTSSENAASKLEDMIESMSFGGVDGLSTKGKYVIFQKGDLDSKNVPAEIVDKFKGFEAAMYMQVPKPIGGEFLVTFDAKKLKAVATYHLKDGETWQDIIDRLN